MFEREIWESAVTLWSCFLLSFLTTVHSCSITLFTSIFYNKHTKCFIFSCLNPLKWLRWTNSNVHAVAPAENLLKGCLTHSSIYFYKFSIVDGNTSHHQAVTPFNFNTAASTDHQHLSLHLLELASSNCTPPSHTIFSPSCSTSHSLHPTE